MKKWQITLQRYGIVFVLVAMVIFFGCMSKAFFKFDNIINVARQVSILGIIAVGMTLVMLTGGIDLSVGSIVGLSGVLAATLMATNGVNVILSIIITLVVVTLFGFISGLAITKLDIPPLIATLGVMTMARGVAYIISNGLPIYRIPAMMTALGQGYIAYIPIPVVVMILVFVLGIFLLNKTYFGRYFYAIGGNAEATRLSGINVKRMTLIVYILCSLLSGLAGMILMGRLNSGQPSAGSGLELDVVTAVVLGGVSVSGGEGKMSGVVVGVIIMGVLANGLLLMNVSDYYQMVIKGAVLILAVGFDKIAKRNAGEEIKA